MKITDFEPTKMVKQSSIQEDGKFYPTDIGEPIVFFNYWDSNRVDMEGYVDSINQRHGGTVIFFSALDGQINAKTAVTKEWFDNCTFHASNYEQCKESRKSWSQ